MELLLGTICVLLALGLVLGVALRPSHQLPIERRRPVDGAAPTHLSKLAGGTTGILDRFLSRHPIRLFNNESLERAGLRFRQSDFLVLITAVGLLGMVLGLLVSGIGLGILLFFLTPLGGYLFVQRRVAKRR